MTPGGFRNRSEDEGRPQGIWRIPPETIAERASVCRQTFANRAPIRLELQTPSLGRPFFRAVMTADAAGLIETPSDQSGAEGGSKFFLEGGDGGN
jgi:hypothetical protein